MSEMVRTWLGELYADAIKESKAAIANERIWQNGAESDDAIMMHEQNIADLEEYVEVLQDRIDAL